MEDFNKQLSEFKSCVITETQKLVAKTVEKQDNCFIAFANPVTCHIIDGDACYFMAHDIRYSSEDGNMYLYGNWPNGDAADGIFIKDLSVESCVKILEYLQDTLRDTNVKKLRSLGEKYPDGIKCDGTFSIRSIVVEGIGFTLDGKVVLDFTDNGESCYKIISEDKFTNDELVELLSYFEDQLSKQIDISLTPAQQTAVEKFKAALKELKEQKVVIIEDHCTDLFVFVNGNGIDYAHSGYEEGKEYFCVDRQVGELDGIAISDMTYFSDDNLVLAKKE